MGTVIVAGGGWATAESDLRNIQNMIRLTKENIDALNERFAGFRDPPHMYLQEYSDLTTKLHDFERKEQELREISVHDEMHTHDDVTIPQIRSAQVRVVPEDVPFHSITDEWPSPRSPMKSVIRAHLPNQQRTSVQIRPGQTVREALDKAMKRRKLTPEMCAVYRNSKTNLLVPWDLDISKLEGEEIRVEILDKFHIPTSISHNFVRKTFFSLVYCECCRRLLFQGFYCRTCGYRFHQRCAGNVPALCQHARMEHMYYQTLLAQTLEPTAELNLSPPNETQQFNHKDHPPPLGQRERSTSAPNVCYNLVGQSAEISDDLLHRITKGTIHAYKSGAIRLSCTLD